ncbi:S8 family serine peptidase [Gorillibacterium sp. CAU 1737]|uniref:S8 family serine peptidase n=1 Tax=Gorillibacterium sp. CAU 1737 TaxID=3140362 RepID=UPI003261BFEF
MEKGIKKLSLLALALGVTVSGIPGLASAANLPLSDRALAEALKAVQPVISSKIDTTSSKKVRVVVQLSAQPAAVGKYAAKQGLKSLAAEATEAKVLSQQTSVLNKAESKGIDLEVNYQYDTVLNGFEVTIPANELPELAKIPGVASIHENSTWYAEPDQTDTTVTTATYDNAPIKQVSADWAWAQGYTGAGLKIGVIDTGIDYLHPDIAPAYVGGYDSFYKDNDPYEEHPVWEEDFPGTSHGTHVAGTIIGQFKNTGEYAQQGIAPGAKLYSYKVLGRDAERPDRASGSTAQVLDGIEHAVKDGMDVLNLSLGSDAEKDTNSPEVIALNNAVLSGITVVVANGNAGPGYKTMGSPASTQLGISVGAVTSESKHYDATFTPIVVDDSVNTATYATYGKTSLMAWTTLEDDFVKTFGTDPIPVVYVGLGDVADYYEKDSAGKLIKDSNGNFVQKNIEGKVVLISRGSLTFVDKIAIAKEFGAKAAVIFNGNAAGTQADLRESINGRDGYMNVSLGDSFNFLPTFDLSGKNGRALARLIVQQGKSLEFKFSPDYPSTIIAGDELATFTSMGPNFDSNLSIKPDISAPGVNVMSTVPAYGKDFEGVSYDYAYDRLSGTSMATPHVAGLALLIKQAHPTYTPFDVRAALANTADALDATGQYGSHDYYFAGPGRANVKNAILTPGLLTAVEPISIVSPDYTWKDVVNYNPTASFGLVTAGSDATKQLQLKNTSDKALSYTASIEWLEGLSDPDNVKATVPSKVSVAAGYGNSQTFDLALTVGEDTAPDYWYEGAVVLTPDNGGQTLRLPFVVHVGDTETPFIDIDQITLTNKLIYPNRVSQNTTDLSYRLNSTEANLLQVIIVDLDGNEIAVLDELYTGDKTIPAGTYKLDGIDGTYYDAEGTLRSLKDGTYSIYIFATLLDSSGEPVRESDDSLKVNYIGITSFHVDNTSTSGGGGVFIPAPTTNEAASSVVDQGLKQQAVTSASETKDGVATVTVKDDALKAAVTAAGTSPAAIVITDSAANAKLSLTADQVKLLSALPAKSTIVFSAGTSAVALPTALLANAPASAKLELVVKPSEEAKSSFTAKLGTGTLVGTPVAFEANWVTEAGSKAVSTPNNVFIKRSFTVPGSIEPNKAGVLFEKDGVVTPVSSVFKKQSDGKTLVTVNRPGFSVYAAATRTIAFTDIAASAAADQIQALANKWIIDGTSATTFSPNANLTRAEFTALLVRALGLKATAAASFTDVKSSDWFAADVAAASEAGLIKGIGGGKFAPNDKVTRQELAVILDRALKLTGIELKPSDLNPKVPYTDEASVAGYAKDSVKALTEAGVIKADGTTYRPNVAATRDFAAAALYALLTKTGLSE